MLLAHGLSDKTTSEVMIQRQVVTQLKVQLKNENARLAAMMKHLYPGQTLQSSQSSSTSSSDSELELELEQVLRANHLGLSGIGDNGKF